MTKTTKTLFAAGIVSLLIIAMPNLASADARSRQKKLDKAAARAENARVTELQRDRAELRRDYAELERDRAELRRLHRAVAGREEIIRKRQEVQDGLREIAQDRREIRDDIGALRRDRDNSNGWSGQRRLADDRSSRNDNNGWGWGRDRRDDQGRWNKSDLIGTGVTVETDRACKQFTIASLGTFIDGGRL